MSGDTAVLERPRVESKHHQLEAKGLPHVLVVDDEKGPRQALRILLNINFEVTLASNVDVAMQTLPTQPFEAIITDLRMPNKSGIELLRHVKERYPDLAVIILTGHGQLETARQAVELGAFAYLEKPFDNNDLLQYVDAAIAKSRENAEHRRLERLAFEANRFSTIGRVVAGMIHDLGTPLSVIATNTEFMMLDPGRDDAPDRLDAMHSQVRQCADIVRSAMSFLRYQPREQAMFSLNDVLNTCMGVARPLLRDQRVETRIDLAEGIPRCRGDLMMVRQGILNLITNACHAMEKQSAPMVVHLRTWAENDCVCVAVEDTGPGVPPEMRARIFDTFFTTNDEGGTGLGLAVVTNVMQEHGGVVELADDNEHGGAMFILRFPAVQGDAQPEA